MKTQNNENIIKDYDLSERLDHIAYMFNVRTKRKKYENFIINAIYTKVNNPELMPVTQQYVKNGNKYYLLDLYFPQINFGVEIDEGHHLNEENKESDKVREEGIKTAIACEEVRIPIYNENGKKRSYKDICQDIDSIVELIQKKIKEKGTLLGAFCFLLFFFGKDFFYILFKFYSGQHNKVSAATAFDTEIDACS